MECEECNQRPATLHFTKLVNGQKQEKHVCGVCAREKGYMSNQEDNYSLHHLLTELFNFETPSLKGGSDIAFQNTASLKCPKCDMTYQEFKRIGKFGCPTCYKTFGARLDPILRRVHGGNVEHVGKVPTKHHGSLHIKKRIQEHKKYLQELIESENFEEAAMVRDEIKELERQIKNNSDGAGDIDDFA